MLLLKKLLLQNKAWATWNKDVDPEYFDSMSKDQKPEILWIGCSDSRVPPDEVINTKPGTLFVHRNIANLVYETDQNLMSVMEYAVKYLKVNYVIVCGHYNCGGVRAALEGIDNARLKNWTSSISENISKHLGPKDLNSVVEMNVIKQVEALKNVPVIQEAWKNSEYPKLVGWVYDINSGLIKELKLIDPMLEVKPN